MVNWHDIRDKAISFAHEYKDAKEEDKWAKSFWVRFFDVFEVRERSIGIFEERVKLLSGVSGKIDFFAPGRFLIEHKTTGKSLDGAFTQAADYFDAISEDQKPRYIIVSDFEWFRIYDLEATQKKRIVEFKLSELPDYVERFAFLTDEKVREYKEEDHINVRAVRAIGKLYEALKTSTYRSEHISPLLTRLVFCFFADDTGIFNKNDLRRYLEENTKEDGSDIGAHLGLIFDVLDTPADKRQDATPDVLKALPYVNGGLFKEPLAPVFGTRAVRDTLLACSAFNWSNISPAIFGSMFQSIMNEKERHDMGAHYTSEENILKVINGLFLEALQIELEAAKTNEAKLYTLWDKLAGITLLDPACGCGNFLVVAYRELRRVETEIIKRLDKGKKGYVAQVEAGQAHFGLEEDLKNLSRLSVENMYGIELEAFPAEIAKLSLWLIDHVMNMELGAIYGKPLRKLPLTEAPHIVQGNALRLDWEQVVPKTKLSYILGNPPFIGSKVMSDEQRIELADIFGDGGGVLDYVSGWYLKAAQYIQSAKINVAFVSTNSITQGEQVGILWKELIEKYTVYIHFAHRTFKWSNEAPGKAAVFCVIVGFGLKETEHPKLYEYEDIRGEPYEIVTKHINPYLVDAPDAFIESRSKPICNVPEIRFGNQPIDGGLLTKFNAEEKVKFLQEESRAEKYFRRFVGADEFLNGVERWCLWLKDADPSEIRKMPPLMRQIGLVKEFRLLSKRADTRKLADTPTLFAFVTQTDTDYIVIPRHSSESRAYLPMGYLTPDVIVGDSCLIIRDATKYHFGILQSIMHMAWMRTVCGRIKSDYRYSNAIVYNNFPWPTNVSEVQKKEVEGEAQAVLDARKQFPGSTLADLYDPNTMPKILLDAHHKLDRAVDACYRERGFKLEPERLEFLFELYKKYISAEFQKVKS